MVKRKKAKKNELRAIKGFGKKEKGRETNWKKKMERKRRKKIPKKPKKIRRKALYIRTMFILTIFRGENRNNTQVHYRR